MTDRIPVPIPTHVSVPAESEDEGLTLNMRRLVLLRTENGNLWFYDSDRESGISEDDASSERKKPSADKTQSEEAENSERTLPDPAPVAEEGSENQKTDPEDPRDACDDTPESGSGTQSFPAKSPAKTEEERSEITDPGSPDSDDKEAEPDPEIRNTEAERSAAWNDSEVSGTDDRQSPVLIFQSASSPAAQQVMKDTSFDEAEDPDALVMTNPIRPDESVSHSVQIPEIGNLNSDTGIMPDSCVFAAEKPGGSDQIAEADHVLSLSAKKPGDDSVISELAVSEVPERKTAVVDSERKTQTIEESSVLTGRSPSHLFSWSAEDGLQILSEQIAAPRFIRTDSEDSVILRLSTEEKILTALVDGQQVPVKTDESGSSVIELEKGKSLRSVQALTETGSLVEQQVHTGRMFDWTCLWPSVLLPLIWRKRKHV